MSYVVFDIEGNGLLDTLDTLWCWSLYDIDSNLKVSNAYGEEKEHLREYLTNPEVTAIGHNIIAYDLPALKMLWGLEYTCKVYDTYVMSCLLYPDRRGGHSLEAWGQRLRFPKGDWSDFSHWHPDMLEYCKKDVDLTYKVYQRLLWEQSR